MKESVRTLVISKILGLIPAHIKPVDFLSDILDISKESAYRRIKGKMPFHFEELICLSEVLGFSLDELVALKKDNNKTSIDLKINNDTEQAFLDKIRRHKIDVDNRLQDKSSIAMIALNYLPAEFCVHHENLFKLSYYLWYHWENKGVPKSKLSEIKISHELEELRKYTDLNAKRLGNNILIFDPNVFLTPISLILYLYELKLINNEEKKLIKKDLQDLIDTIEKMIRTDLSYTETKNYLYLSEFNIDVNSSYYTWNDNACSSFLLYFFYRIIIYKPQVCEAHKDWLLSLKKYSTLITGSNEIEQAKYLNKQKKYIDLL